MTAKYDPWNTILVSTSYILKYICICALIHKLPVSILIFWLIEQPIEHTDDDDDDDDNKLQHIMTG